VEIFKWLSEIMADLYEVVPTHTKQNENLEKSMKINS